MDETPTNENPAANESSLNKIDLSQLHGFSFGTQWSQDKTSSRENRHKDERPHREERREGAPSGADRRDRRGFRKPQNTAATEGEQAGGTPGAASQTPSEGGERSAPRHEFRGGPRREFRSGPRREGPGGERGEFRGGPRREFRSGPQERAVPYESPFFTVTFYPEDTSFLTLAKTIRSSCRTIELFEIARTVIGKNDRFVAVLQRKAPAAQTPATPSGDAAQAPAVPSVKPAPFYISVPDSVPFETEDAAIAHVLKQHVGLFFDVTDAEIDPPKGNYQIINRCGVTGELLAPPNYHRYNQIVQQHFANRIQHMSIEAFRAKIESVRDPEVVNQWLQKMRKVTRYTWKTAVPAAPAAAEGETPAADAPPSFDSIEEARTHLLTHARDKVVRITESARFHGRVIESIPHGEIRRAVESTLERQRRFPLDTANALRGRLRREGFTIFKKGSKGISYVCAVKRKFRVPGQTFAESINALISFIEAHPMIKAGELTIKFLGIGEPQASDSKPVEQSIAAPSGENAAVPEAPAEAPAIAPAPEAASAPAQEPAPTADADAVVSTPSMGPEQREKLSRMQGDLVWLVHEGYVTEFIDGRLFAPPPMVEARKKEVESEDHDPENFPETPAEAPVAAEPATPAPEQPSPETTASATEQAPAVTKPETPASEMTPPNG